MFTGIIQGEGEIRSVERQGQECRLCVRPCFALERVADGESIAVNGACLSVERHNTESFTAYASAETLARTTLGSLVPGSRVNLERALALGDRLGGHLVSGHVDCIAEVAWLGPAGQSLACRLVFPLQFGDEVIVKGTVALDGISLTVNECGPDFLVVNVIPDTQRRTTMRRWRPGSRVNMETDLIGKYVRRVCAPWFANSPDTARSASARNGISREMLMRNGIL